MRLLASAAAFLAIAVSAFATPPVPRKSPDFTIAEPSGKQLLVSSFKGKVVMLNFMSTTCPHCQALAQMVTKVQQDLGPRGFQALGVAFNEIATDMDPANGRPFTSSQAMVNNFIKKFGVGFPVGYSAREPVLNYLGISVMSRYVYPQIALIDRKGNIVAQSIAEEGSIELQTEKSLRALVEKLLKEGATTGAVTAKKGVAKSN